MSTVFPVEVEIVGNLVQGFTRNVSADGMCVELKVFERELEKFLERPQAPLGLTINAFFLKNPLKAAARVAWLQKDAASGSRYFIGVRYTDIDRGAGRRLLRYARRRLWAPRLGAAAGLLLAGLLVLSWFRGQKLLEENRRLVNRIVASAVQISEEAPVRPPPDPRMVTSMLRQMIEWLKAHQNRRTGLVASFEGDPALEDKAFTYDQSLVSQAFLIFGEVRRAWEILSFFESRAARKEGGFFNAYDTVYGHPREEQVNAGPTIWVGIAALQYERRVKDGHFLPMARELGSWVMALQDQEGGVRGGPSVHWMSTEHNLDAYALFSMLYEETGDEKYAAARDRVLAWIKTYAYSATARRMIRGKGDSTIATDTFSWAVAALGPRTLKEHGFDPEAILDYAEDHCEVTVPVTLSDGTKTRATGFDFAKAQNIGRGGVISAEWTAQMIVSYRILAEHFKNAGDKAKAAGYRDKSFFYLNELQKLLITSPSRTGQGRGCLPYASVDNIDTGHGWRTPKGKSTGSLAATAYGIFAWTGYNPFSGKGSKDGDFHLQR